MISISLEITILFYDSINRNHFGILEKSTITISKLNIFMQAKQIHSCLFEISMDLEERCNLKSF